MWFNLETGKLGPRLNLPLVFTALKQYTKKGKIDNYAQKNGIVNFCT